MKVAITSADTFVAPYIQEMLGDSAILVPEESLADLNARLDRPITMERFRPNLIVAGALPYAEDTWSQFQIGPVRFFGAKPCTRCVVTTIDPETLATSSEPLRTLATYRRWESQAIFGYNLVHAGEGRLQVGDPLEGYV